MQIFSYGDISEIEVDVSFNHATEYLIMKKEKCLEQVMPAASELESGDFLAR